MAETSDISQANKEVIYTFRFDNSNKCVHLIQQQLNHLPYLSTLVYSTNKFLSTKNENNEYILNSSIDYNSFMIILDSISSKTPYNLFNKLEEHENVLNILELIDYLGINLFCVPVFKDEYLNLSKSINNDNRKGVIQYHRANLSEMRNKAAEFIIALNKNEYNLDDIRTLNNLFSLLMFILSTPKGFSSRFRHHTLTVVNKCCFSLFSTEQQCQLPTTQEVAEKKKFDSLMYLCDDDLCLPEFISNAFAWKTVYISTEENVLHSKNSIEQSLLPDVIYLNYLLQILNISTSKNVDIKQKQQRNYVQSRYFHILPKKINVAKFKNRFSSKTQKYR
ncbi:unnamed protein product [Rotaria sordida]|uniref:Uncharacterized protein n=1 Tax=Rotaria sordida TaxID=392033 RepID=A0A818UAZ6_9BILA|nr:unnamed protein product [Rotaria sordida]